MILGWRWDGEDPESPPQFYVDQFEDQLQIGPYMCGSEAEQTERDPAIQVDITISASIGTAVYRVTGYDWDNRIFRAKRIR